MNVISVREQVRSYIAHHPTKTQQTIADEVGVSNSWLNKFACGKSSTDNFGIERLQALIDWMHNDQSQTSGSATEAQP